MRPTTRSLSEFDTTTTTFGDDLHQLSVPQRIVYHHLQMPASDCSKAPPRAVNMCICHLYDKLTYLHTYFTTASGRHLRSASCGDLISNAQDFEALVHRYQYFTSSTWQMSSTCAGCRTPLWNRWSKSPCLVSSLFSRALRIPRNASRKVFGKDLCTLKTENFVLLKNFCIGQESGSWMLSNTWTFDSWKHIEW